MKEMVNLYMAFSAAQGEHGMAQGPVFPSDDIVENEFRLMVVDVFGTVTDLVLGHPGIYSNLLELQHTIMYFTTLRHHLTRANAGLSS
jgi:hypothetical protein